MKRIISTKGFGFLELLVVLVVITVLSTLLLRSHRRSKGETVSRVEKAMREDLENRGALTLSALMIPGIAGKNSAGAFEYGVQGAIPFQSLARSGSSGTQTLADRLVYFRLTAYDPDNHSLPDNPSAQDLARLARIRVEMAVHAEKESPDFYMNDGERGVDLDGDPGNGTSHVTPATFGLIVKSR